MKKVVWYFASDGQGGLGVVWIFLEQDLMKKRKKFASKKFWAP